MIIPFYLGEQPDSEGRKITEIWAWDFEELEYVHDYIQWLFPLTEPSAFNLHAPIIDEQVIQSFHSNLSLRQNLLRSFTVMLEFYGLQRHESKGKKIIISKSEDYGNRKGEWICMFNHNYLRITRILKCLMTLGLENEAQGFYECLRQIYQEDSNQIGSKTFHYWTIAVKGNVTI
ncbi:MAG: opioid growth factor receptor-related protein [Nostoc sp. ChiSLP01]|nr:opioid growth factor receptor-related protein [Nostoc sp. CmiSLP01]MDZ8282909.1 opioid growth factor receptor-related protein [Nostoc sp. ChiSLP01]